MPLWLWFVSYGITFLAGFFAGVWGLYETWLKPSMQKGLLNYGGAAFRVSRIVPRNTRI